MEELTDSSRNHLLKNLKSIHGKSPAFLAGSYKGAWANGMTLIYQDMENICVAQRGRSYRGEPQHLEICPVAGKTNCLTSVAKDNMIMELSTKQLNPSKESQGRQPYQQNRVYDINHKSPAHCADLAGVPRILTRKGLPLNNGDKSNALCVGGNGAGNNSQTVCRVVSPGRIRRLTPTECARLQTVPGWYKWQCSGTQQYKMLGNGWTVEVIKHILSFLPEELKNGENNNNQKQQENGKRNQNRQGEAHGALQLLISRDQN